MSASVSRNATGWSREDVLELLCSLNMNSDEIRREFLEDRKAGIAFATVLLSDAVGRGHTPAGVRAKLFSLWKSWRSDTSKTVDDLYRHGAWTQTLPRLDLDYPGMLEDIKSGVKMKQRGIECICGFTHYAGRCVQCDKCYYWQHICCYYETEEAEVPGHHFCEKCHKESQTNTGIERGTSDELIGEAEVSEMFPKLQVSDRNTLVRDNSDCQPSTFGFPEDEDDVLWGPMEEDVVHELGVIAFRIRTIANSISSSAFSFRMLPSNSLVEHEVLSDLFTTCFGVEITKHVECNSLDEEMTSLLPVDVLKALIAAAVTKWSFFPDPWKIQSAKSLLLKTYQELIYLKVGNKALQSLHRAAWNRLVDECPEPLQALLTREAEEMASRLLVTLSPLVGRVDDPVPLKSIHEWIQCTENGQKRYNLLVQTFTMTLKLMINLPMSKKRYEVFFPAVDTVFDLMFMTTEYGDPKGKRALEKQEVQLCLMPALIEYHIEIKDTEAGDLTGLFGSHNFINTTDSERAKGRVVYRAIVKLR